MTITPQEIEEITARALKTPPELEVAEGRTYSPPVQLEVFLRRPGDDVAVAADIIDPVTGEPSRETAEFFARARADILRLRGELLEAQRLADYWEAQMKATCPSVDAMRGLQQLYAPELKGAEFDPRDVVRAIAAREVPSEVEANARERGGTEMFFRCMEVVSRTVADAVQKYSAADPTGAAVIRELTGVAVALARVRFPEAGEEGDGDGK